MVMQLTNLKTENNVLVPLKEQVSLSPKLKRALTTAFTFAPDYEWFGAGNLDKACQCLEAMIQVYGENQSFFEFFKGAILDLQKKDETEKIDFYDNQRAEEACKLLANNQKPTSEIPRSIQQGGRLLHASRSKLQTWRPGTPFDVLPALARVAAQALPDALILVTYKDRSQRSADPVIYAQYGKWLVKLAEWE